VLPDQNSNSNTKKRWILAVDDEPDITLTVKAGLEATGLFQVDTFNDPELALSSFKPRLYDIVLLDFKMPKMYGYEIKTSETYCVMEVGNSRSRIVTNNACRHNDLSLGRFVGHHGTRSESHFPFMSCNDTGLLLLPARERSMESASRALQCDEPALVLI
jgi:hypothetical protein